jgi:hypothetical protein
MPQCHLQFFRFRLNGTLSQKTTDETRSKADDGVVPSLSGAYKRCPSFIVWQ